MKNVIIVCLLAAVAWTYSIQASANSPGHNINIPIEDNIASLHIFKDASHAVAPLELKPLLASKQGIKLAAVCSITDPTCTGVGFGSGNNDINLDNNAQCKDEGFGTTCGYGYVPDTSQKCPYNNSFFKCRVCSHTCNSGSLNYCSSDQVETGSSRNDCNETCYTCRAKTCEEGGYASSINSCQKASAVSFAGKTCYTSVSAKSCTDGGYVASIPSNNTCSSTSYCGNTCYHSCSQPTCATGGFKDAIPTNNACTSTTYYGRTCYKDCYQPSCGAGGYNASIPANNLCSSVSYYGQTCYKDCYQPACSSGGFVDACPANQIGTAVSHYGRTCYKGCYTPACSAGGFVDACPSGQAGTVVSYYGKTCYKDCYNTDCNVTSKTCTAGCKTMNSCGKCTECNTDTATICANKGYSNSVYCSSTSGMNTEYCPENASYKKCIFSCATYKESIMSEVKRFQDESKNSYADACGKLCMNKPIWPSEYCEPRRQEVDNLTYEYYKKCGERLSAFLSCPRTSCRDGMLGVDMCGNNEMDR